MVTGASGFIGYHLSQKLIDLGGQVFALSRNSTKENIPDGCIPVSANIAHFEELKGSLSHIDPHFVFHLAGIVTTKADSSLILPALHQNVLGTVNLLVSLLNSGCKRFVNVGTSEEVGKISGYIKHISPYMASKSAANLFVKLFKNAYEFPITIVKPFLVYGPRQNEVKLIPYIILCLLRSNSLHISNPNRICDLIYIKDAVDGLILSCFRETTVGIEVDLGTGVGTQIKDLVSLLFDIVDPERKLDYTTGKAQIFLDPLIADIAQTKEFLKWTPQHSMIEGINETISWYKALEKKS